MQAPRGSLFVLIVALLGCAGCATTRAGGWLEVSTRDVRLRTDIDADDATELAVDLQRHRDALVATTFSCGSSVLTEPVRITLFAVESDFDAVASPDARTLLEATRNHLVELPPELLMKPSPNRRLLRQAALYEMVHTLSAECYPGLPPWLSQGLSLFYETVEIDGDALVAGRPKYVVRQPEDLTEETAPQLREIIAVPDSAIPSIVEVLGFRFDELFQQIDYPDSLRESERARLLGRHAGAWALTHALSTVDVSTYARLKQFMEELRFGETPRGEAWRSTMSGIDLERLYEDWTAINVRYPLVALGFEAVRDVAVTRRIMSDSEVELHLAARWGWNSEQTRAMSVQHLDRAIELDANEPTAYLMRAAIANAAGLRDETAEWLSRAVAVAPEDPRVIRSALVFGMSDAGTRQVEGAGLAELVLSLERRASTAAQYDALARYYLEVAEDTMEARYWAARALRRNPSCAACGVTAGDVLAEAGQPTLAATMYKRALNLGAHDPALDRDYLLRALESLDASSPAP